MAAPATSLPAALELRRDEIAEVCVRYGVARLEVFGSAAGSRFDPAHSDFDFLVEFGSTARWRPLEQYFGLKEALEALFGRPVDLIEAGASSNRYFLESMNASRRLLYAA